MKIFLILVAFVLTTSFAAAQTFNYQATARDASGDLLVVENLGVQARLLAGSAGGAEAYAEAFNVTTNANGVFNLAIGGSGDISLLDWGTVTYFLEISIDDTGGTTYALVGATELRTVPVALTSTKFELQVGNTNVILLASTVIANTGNITSLSLSDANHGARLLTLENANLDARLTTAEGEIVQNTSDISDEETRALAAEGVNATAISVETADRITDVDAAEATAAGDATTKANTAETNAKSYADTGDATLQGNIETNTTAIVLNTAKIGYTEAAVSANTDVAANTAKVGYTDALVSANTDVAANTAKVGYTDALVSANTDVAANTAKVGYTDALVSANTDVAANTAKVGYTEALVSANTCCS